MPSLYTLYHLAAFAIGACLGSFLNVVVLRLPDDRSISHPPSACPVCETPLRWYDNIPVLSWLQLRASCRTCGTSISPMYPLIELVMGLVAWLLWLRFVPRGAELDPAHLTAFASYLAFAWLLLCAAYTDVRHHIILDQTSSYAVPFAIAAMWLVERLGYHGWLAIGWKASVLGALVAYGFLWVVSKGWFLAFKQEGLAMGDVKLFGLVGAFVGPAPGAFFVLLVSMMTGGLVGAGINLARRRNGYLPFAPYIAFAGLLFVLYGDAFVSTDLMRTGALR